MDDPPTHDSRPRQGLHGDRVAEAERVCTSRSKATVGQSLRSGIHSRRRRRKLGYRAGLWLGAALVVAFGSLPEGQVLAKGPANPGHEGLGCKACHDPAPGTVRQQLQAAVAFGLGLRESAPRIGRLPVTNQVCLDCHEREGDQHPTYLFTQPKYAEERGEIAAHLCVTCHVEHSGRHVANTGRFCSTCHAGMEVKHDPARPTHASLVSGERWDTCLRCHDYHGNHARVAPDSLEAALGGRDVLRHLDSGVPVYGEKREAARTVRRGRSAEAEPSAPAARSAEVPRARTTGGAAEDGDSSAMVRDE